jgi:ADP-heptose:LPS heptosyltransferase
MLYPARSILTIDLSPFGQSLAMLPVIRAIRDSYPNTLLVAAAPGGTCELLTAGGLVDETISLGVVKVSDHARAGTLKRLLGLAKATRRRSFDVVLDFSASLEAMVVSRLILRARVFTPSKLPRVISLLLDLGGTPRVSLDAQSDYANVLQQLGVVMNDVRLAITPSVEEDARFEHRLSSSGSRGGELIVLLYAANPLSRRSWPVDAFGEVGTRLANNFNARIVAADEPSDDAFNEGVRSWLPPGAIRLAKPRALELIAAIARASLVITDEPGIALVASELSTPVIEIADANSSCGESSSAHRIAQGSSMSRVSPEAVYEIASELIQENRSGSLFRRP